MRDLLGFSLVTSTDQPKTDIDENLDNKNLLYFSQKGNSPPLAERGILTASYMQNSEQMVDETISLSTSHEGGSKWHEV